MNIDITDRAVAESMIQNEFYIPNEAVISFYDPENEIKVDYSSLYDRVFYVELPDISFYDLDSCGYTLESFFPEADRLAEFIIKAHNDGYNFLCQCEHGENRSTAAAAAIGEFFDHDGIKVFSDYRFCPNQLVYNKIYDALVHISQKS